MTLDTVIHASPDQVSCSLGSEAAILNLHTGIYYSLDPVGAAVWKLIEQPQTVADIRDAMLNRFEVELERCELDLFQLFEELAAKGLIEIRDGHS